MKRNLLAVFVILALCMSTAVLAEDDRATREECVAMVNTVVEKIQAEGFEAMKPAIEKVGGPYMWKDGYVFCLDTKECVMLAHPFFPKQMMGRPMAAMTDSNGKEFMKELMETANRDGEGWVQYMARRRGSREPQLKDTYVKLVPGADVIVGSGYYPVQDQ